MEAWRGTPRHWFLYALDVAALLSLTLEQPLFDLISRYPQFLVAQDVNAPVLLMLVVSFAVLAPAGMALTLWVASKLLLHAQWWQAGGIWVLATLLCALFLKRVSVVPGVLLLTGAAIGGLIAATAYARSARVRLLVTALAPAVVVVPLLFVLNPSVSRAISDTPALQTTAVSSAPDTPIVMVILDELPVDSLLDESGAIDSRRFPNFAKFADDATWFKRSNTVHEATKYALPAILTGKYPSRDFGQVASAVDYPDNLISWLTPTHQLHVSESSSRFCPECATRSLLSDAFGLLKDLTIVYTQLLLPDDLSQEFPSIENTWADFGHDLRDQSGSKAPLEQFKRFIDEIQATSKPSLHFLHVQLPHLPWVYLPSGKRYLQENDADAFLRNEEWAEDENRVKVAFQRHLLQVGLVDRLLGRLMDRLGEVDLYDRSLIVVASDHGASFRPGGPRRKLTELNRQGILSVPLLIKAPGQVSGTVSETAVETVDILPTMTAILKIDSPWPVDGRSVWPGNSGREERTDRPRPPTPRNFNLHHPTTACLDGEARPVTLEKAWAYLDVVRPEGERILFFGWAAHKRTLQPADEVLVFSGEQLIHRASTGYRRPGLAKTFDAPSLERAGYLFTVDPTRLGPEHRVRVMARFGDQIVEMKYPNEFPWPRAALQDTEDDCSPVRCNSAAQKEASYLVTRACVSGRGRMDPFQDELRGLAWSASDEGLFTWGMAELLGKRLEELQVEQRPDLQLRLDSPSLFENVELNGTFIPAAVNGTLTRGPEVDFVAVVVNGRIWGLAPSFQQGRATRLFQVMVPEDSLTQGHNQVVLLAVTRSGSGVRAETPESSESLP